MTDKEIISPCDKCEPLWNGKEYINCKNCKIKEECECWYELNKEFNIYNEDAE